MPSSKKSESSEKLENATPKVKKVNPGFMKALTPTEILAAVIGPEPIPRTEAVKKIWEYIKKNNLQEPTNKRNINADDKLLPVFDGKKQISMFELTKLLSNNLK
jgi:upstream activation factor subunit UAF30